MNEQYYCVYNVCLNASRLLRLECRVDIHWMISLTAYMKDLQTEKNSLCFNVTRGKQLPSFRKNIFEYCGQGVGGGRVGRGLFYFGQTFIGYPFYWCERVEGKNCFDRARERERTWQQPVHFAENLMEERGTAGTLLCKKFTLNKLRRRKLHRGITWGVGASYSTLA